MKTIILCRHAKSDWPLGVDDMDRPLKGRGQKDARRLGEFLNANDFHADLIISSPANRAISTARIIAEQTGYDPTVIKEESNLYFGSTGETISLIQALPDEHNIAMMFGHNPTMETAVSHLLQLGTMFQMPTSGMVCIESYVNRWERLDPANTALRWALVPRLMRKSES